MIPMTIFSCLPERPKRRRNLGLALAGAMGMLLASSWAWALQVSGLESPHSFLADPPSRSYFISNINGETNARDNNGFITKLSDDGRIIAFKFIEGGRGDVTLHAPKGMAIVDHVLYVTDVDTLRAFDKNTGKPLATVVLPGPPTARPPSRSWMWRPTGRGICISRIRGQCDLSCGSHDTLDPVPLCVRTSLSRPVRSGRAPQNRTYRRGEL